jgi:hypothetical protein
MLVSCEMIAGNGISVEAEESPLLEAITKQWLVKT